MSQASTDVPHLTVFTDGACSGNPGPGGWAAVLLTPEGRVKELGGGEPRTTNNRMEMRAVIESLKAARALSLPVRVYTDSTYVIQGVTAWVHGWRRRGWTTADGSPVMNRDLWEELDALARALSASGLSWHYVRGHSGSPGNERCDRIAVSFSKGPPEPLYEGPVSGAPAELTHFPADEPLPRPSPGKAPKEKRKGGYYLSLVGGHLERHQAWPDCQARVQGVSGARFKKVFTTDEEGEVLRGWGLR